MGRTPKDIDGAAVFRMAATNAKVTEIAEHFDCDRDLIHRRFAAELRKGRAQYRLTIRERIFNQSKNNVGATMFLCRTVLGMTEDLIDADLAAVMEEQGLTKEDLIELAKMKDKIFTAIPKRGFEEFCEKAGFPTPFPKQVEMMDFAFKVEDTRLLLGARGIGKTDYLTLLGVAYDIYLNPHTTSNLIITKSKERNTSILGQIEDALAKNGMALDKANSTNIRARGLHGKDDSVAAVTIRTASLRGRHPKRIIMDDPVTEDDTAEAARVLAKKKYNEAMKLTRNICIIGQPAHQYDLYAELRGVVKTLEVPYGCVPELDHDLAAQRLAGVDEASISASYFLKVLTEGTSPFDQVKYLDKYPVGPGVAFIDPSDGGDYTAMSIIRQYMQGIAVVGFVWKKAWNHCLDEAIPRMKQFGVQRLAFETNFTGHQPVEMLQSLMHAHKLGIGVVPWHSSGNKHARIMNAGGYAHQIHLSKESDKLYVDHVVKYEYKAKFDDAPDSLAGALEWIGLIRGQKT